MTPESEFSSRTACTHVPACVSDRYQFLGRNKDHSKTQQRNDEPYITRRGSSGRGYGRPKRPGRDGDIPRGSKRDNSSGASPESAASFNKSESANRGVSSASAQPKGEAGPAPSAWRTPTTLTMVSRKLAGNAEEKDMVYRSALLVLQLYVKLKKSSTLTSASWVMNQCDVEDSGLVAPPCESSLFCSMKPKGDTAIIALEFGTVTLQSPGV